ncbi:hypothetical protein HTY52_18460 [Cupriavidus taiwanensis]|uniref:Z1 domain-containing protein n=1 Tax=Cupriavidus taiwanensis TaxID=164546 RepID=UPI0015736C34|nr:Z1 domain-containing protein [Cupriavidus taiwanensis]NSX16071.1 hypothetical protein [Cupriavidus taiwanensis]
MLAVAALLLDRGVGILVVLAGTRVALWLQTYERLLNQLDGTDLHSAWTRNRERVIIPQPEDILSGDDRVDPYRYLRSSRLKVREAVQTGKPIIFVVPKEDDHLLALGRFLVDQTGGAALDDRGRPLSLVVLDDEADDASILDARDGSRITPQFIQYLWSSEASAPATRHSTLFATYIAYTATPQANYLQKSHNPLAPRSFHAALRVPSDRGRREPRTVTYTERRGLRSYYSGGEFYYERLRELPGDPCVAFEPPSPIEGSGNVEVGDQVATRWEMIGSAMRCYLVAGAVRMLISGRRLSKVPVELGALGDLRNALPATHSMLYHPSALKEQHFEGAEDIARWSRALPGAEGQVQLPLDQNGNPVLSLDVGGLVRRLDLEEERWREWLHSFSTTAAGLASLPGGEEVLLRAIQWAEVRKLLVEEVFPYVRIRVLNSDPRADERPGFEPTAADATRLRWHAPRDIYTIFVAGNVLSRGLTVEGLCTSLFLRSAREPAADTQMQMQRWFGYRGEHLPFCRVFLYSDQLRFFRQYHHNDLALKTEILNHMDGHSVPFSDGVLVLQGEAFKATAKVDSRRIPLHPGATPAIRLVEPSSGSCYEANIRLVEDLLDDGKWRRLEHPTGIVRGLFRERPFSMLEVATFLERLRYSVHDPDLQLDVSQRWASLQRTLNLSEPLFRPPGICPGPMAVDPSGCPYSIAAYLRLWSAALKRHDLPGMQPTDNPTMPWNMLNLAAYRATEPYFHVGLRFGSEAGTRRLKYQGQPLPMMRRALTENKSHMLETLWGSRNPTERWKGDQFFDFHHNDPGSSPRLLEDGAWRPRGQPGLLLIHPIVEPGSEREIVAFGVALPHGGPDHLAALRVGGGDSV